MRYTILLRLFGGFIAVLTLTGPVAVATQSADVSVAFPNPEALASIVSATIDGLPYVPGELLVKFRDNTTVVQQTSALRVLRSSVSPDQAEWIGETLHLRRLAGEDPVAAAAALERQPEVLYAHPNYIHRLHGQPNDPGYRDQWHMGLINMPQAWEINASAGEGVTVAVLDSGLTTTQGTFPFRIWTGFSFGTFAVPFAPVADFNHQRVRSGADFTIVTPSGGWRTTSGQPMHFDSGGHGTHVAGTIAQYTNNQTGYAGVASGATIMPVKVCFSPWDARFFFGAAGIPGFVSADLNGCDTASVIRGIHYAVDNGANVLNLSLGGPGRADAYVDALRYAVSRGVFVSISAGNSGAAGNPPSYPASYAAAINGVMAVGAVGPSGVRAAYSNYGPYVEIAAPGGSGTEAVSNVWQMFPNQADLSIFRSAPAFTRYTGDALFGTSMAAPHVAGVAALLYSQGIKSPAAIEAAIKRFARDVGPTGRDDDHGHGLIDARATLLGFGVPR